MARRLIRYSTDHLISHACLASARVRLPVLNCAQAGGTSRPDCRLDWVPGKSRTSGPEGATVAADWSRHGLTGPQQ